MTLKILSTHSPQDTECLANRYFGVPDLNHFDVVSPEFLSYVSNARAQHIVLSGFAGDCRPWHGFNYPPWHHMAEIIDKAKYCASQVEYVQCVCFLLDGIDQFETVLENVREFPRTVENLRISLAWAPGGTSPIPAARLNPKRKGISEVLVMVNKPLHVTFIAASVAAWGRQWLRSGANN